MMASCKSMMQSPVRGSWTLRTASLFQRLVREREQQQHHHHHHHHHLQQRTYIFATTSSPSFPFISSHVPYTAGKLRPRLLRRISAPIRNDTLPTMRNMEMMIMRRRMIMTSTNTTTTRRYYTSPMSNAFWKDLNLAVKHGNGEQAESIVNGLLLQAYQEETSGSSSPLDSRILSLVLEAWKRSEGPFAAERAQQLIDQMVQWASEGVITEPPSVEDYHAVLDSWVAYSFSSNKNRSRYWDSSNTADTSSKAAEAVLRMTHQMMQDHAPTPAMIRGVLQILANGGHAAKAVEFVETIKTTVSPSSFSTMMTLDMYNLILEAYARSTHDPNAPHEAQAFLRRMQNNNHDDRTMPAPNGTSYDWVLQCWAAHAEHHPIDAPTNAQRLLAEMKAFKLQTTATSYQTVISIFAHVGEPLQAEKLLSNLLRDYGAQFDAQLKPSTQPFETVLMAYSRSFSPDAAHRAASVLTQMREMYETGWLDRPPDVWSYNLVLKCWMHHQSCFSKGATSQHDPVERALELLERMREVDSGVTPDTSTMNTVLNTLAKQPGNALRAENFLWDFYGSYVEDPVRNPQPDVISFGTVLKAWAVSNDPQAGERAEALLLKLQTLHESLGWPNCQPDQAIYSSVMKCYASSSSRGDNHNSDAPYKAEAILRSMQQAAQENNNPDLKPDTVCWNMVIQAWAQAGQGPRAEALFQEMFQEYLEDKETATAIPNNITFSAVLSAWAKTRRNPQAPERAEALLEHMKQLAKDPDSVLPGIKPNVVSYSIVLDCLAYARTTAAAVRAESLLREMQASDDPAVQPNVISYNSVIKAWSFSRDPNALFKVTALLKEMMDQMEQQREGGEKHQHTIRPNANTFGSVLKVLADSQGVPDKEKRARVVVKLMEKFGIPWNDWSREQMRRCCGDDEKGDGGPSQGQRNRKRQRSSTQNKQLAVDLPDIPDLKYN